MRAASSFLDAGISYLDVAAPYLGWPNEFFWGVSGVGDVAIGYLSRLPVTATRPCSPGDMATPAHFSIGREAPYNSDLTIDWQLGGSAVYGTDYIITNVERNTYLTNGVTITSGDGGYTLAVVPLYNSNQTFDVDMSMTLVKTNGYVIEPNYRTVSATIAACEPTNLFTVVTNLTNPIGIDYSPVTNALIVSVNSGYGGYPNDFDRISTNSSGAVTLTNWSGVAGVSDYNEVKLAIVNTGGALTNSAGFTNGDMFFSSATGVGWLSADGTRSNLTFATLTNNVVTNTQVIRGGLYIDRTGIFSNDLVVAASDDDRDPTTYKGIWLVNSIGQPRLLANILTTHLEGVIVLPMDTNRFGPWAGKIVTGDEDQDLIYTIDTNGAVVTYNTTSLFPNGIDSEDFDIIQTNQNLYCADYGDSQILKISHTLFNNYIGDLLITQSGDGGGLGAGYPKLFIVVWDSTNAVFNIRSINGPGYFEHVTFAPIDLHSYSQ